MRKSIGFTESNVPTSLTKHDFLPRGLAAGLHKVSAAVAWDVRIPNQRRLYKQAAKTSGYGTDYSSIGSFAACKVAEFAAVAGWHPIRLW